MSGYEKSQPLETGHVSYSYNITLYYHKTLENRTRVYTLLLQPVFDNTYFTFFSDFKKRVFMFFISRLKNVKSRLPKFIHRSFEMSSQLRFCFILNFLPLVSYNPYLLLWLANFSWHWIAYNMLMRCLEWVSSFLTAHQHIKGHFSAMLSRSCSPTHAELTEWYLKLHVQILRFFSKFPQNMTF